MFEVIKKGILQWAGYVWRNQKQNSIGKIPLGWCYYVIKKDIKALWDTFDLKKLSLLKKIFDHIYNPDVASKKRGGIYPRYMKII